MGTDIDQLLDIHQEMINMIRQFGGDNVAGLCDNWEKRLYGWHDALLQVTADARQQDPSGENIYINLSSADTETFRDIMVLHEELVETGNGIFKAT